ncbi:major facilitator superfamily domain-containing protein [Thelonectria olida]|uniref:Major facilitator superfamily domain-containing protein n=1 Tax=Thelonectria olida TaxID=1576542 RepID=A0A9P8VXQ5_9HYPO|nr:major facilitator superfamily domain-containing protein [Thelonectria olida]
MDLATIEEKVVTGHSDCQTQTSAGSRVQAIDPKTERRAVRKVDFYVLPALYIIYMACFIDRANIGNVKVADIPEDIGASEAQFSTAISIFYVPYLFRFSPRYALFLPCIIWTVATVANRFVTNVGGLYACRFVLGAAEGDLFPSLNLYLTLVYDREVMETRHQQRLTYMGEGVFSWEEIRLAFTDMKNISTFGFIMFLPAILKTMGQDRLAFNYLTIPIHLLGAIAFIVLATIPDKYEKCGPIILITSVMGTIGYIILLTVRNNAIKYFACFLVSISAYNGSDMNIAWLNVNMVPQYRRAIAIGIQQTLGNLAGIVAGQIYRKSPYVLGKGFSLGSIVLASVLVSVQRMYLLGKNKEKALILAEEKADMRVLKTGDCELEFKD